MERKTVIGKDGLLHCAFCGYPIERVIEFPLLDGSGKKVKRKVGCVCRCELDERKKIEQRMAFEEEQRRINQLRQLSLMDTKLRKVRFKNYQVTEENHRVFSLARKYVEHFREMCDKNQGLLFWGDVGTGKSYTAAAIANELIDQQIPVVMTSFIKLLKECVGINDESKSYIDTLNQAKLMVIDDLGAERSTDYALENVYDIIDSRYRSGKPVILTTNLDIGEMKRCGDIRYNRIYDRIFEMCYPVRFAGMSWRKREAATRFTDTRTILEG